MKKKENIIIVVVLIVMVIAIVGVSYAAFNYSRTGSINTITTGAITMTYEETDNTINLTGALPTTDKTGMVRLNPGEYFDFSISSEITGDVNINYEISAKKEDGNTIDGKYIKLYLTRIKDDGTEDGLMAPETYNEEVSENAYTGRPANEMSLYTSSMNSSESNNYRLRMYVDESYNPQGDGGGLQFTVQINVYGKAGDKYVLLTTKEILEDNELQVEKTNMFNYTADGTYIDNYDDWNILTNPDYVTNGLYSMEDEDGTSYYFRGGNVNNFVQFGTYTKDYYVYRYGNNDFVTLDSCQYYNKSCSESNRVLKYSAGTPMYWRIVRINGDGSLRLIYNGISTDATDKDLGIGNSIYNQSGDDPKYSGYTYDRYTNETDSTAKRDIETWYNEMLKGATLDKIITNGRFCSDSSGYALSSKYGLTAYNSSIYMYASSDRLEQWASNWTKPDRPSLICSDTDETYGGSYRLKVDLITVDEIVLSGLTTYQGSPNDSYLSTYSFSTMSPNSFNKSAYVWTSTGTQQVDNRVNIVLLRPVINVMMDYGFTSGDGNATNPYVIE